MVSFFFGVFLVAYMFFLIWLSTMRIVAKHSVEIGVINVLLENLLPRATFAALVAAGFTLIFWS